MDASRSLHGPQDDPGAAINRDVELKDYPSATFTLKSGESPWYNYSFRDPDGEMIALWD